MTHIAITGVSGHVGGLVAEKLATRGMPLRLVVRPQSLNRTPRLANAEIRTTTYADHENTLLALAGMEMLFMVSASEGADRLEQHRAFITAAAQAGVRHVVYTSFLGASENAIFTLARDHWATEGYLRESGMSFTFLRDNFYLDLLPEFAGEDGIIRGPADSGRVSAVARDDVARVAASVLTSPAQHRDATYDLTGREAITLAEAATTISSITHRTVTFHNETKAEAYESRALYGAPRWQLDAWVSTYTAIASGDLSGISGDVERITGTAPMTLAEYLRTTHR